MTAEDTEADKWKAAKALANKITVVFDFFN